jgi:hypothetical protein
LLGAFVGSGVPGTFGRELGLKLGKIVPVIPGGAGITAPVGAGDGFNVPGEIGLG